jgi:hypothetical protein
MSERKNKAVVERYLKVTLSGNLDELSEIVHSRVKGFDGEDKVAGLAKVRAYFEGVRAGFDSRSLHLANSYLRWRMGGCVRQDERDPQRADDGHGRLGP